MNGLLFIDDEEGVRRSVVRALKKEPYKIYTEDNGEGGIEFIKKNVFDVATVISDYKMPGLNGLETLASIASINPEITRIILTGYATMEAAIMATNDGIDGFLTKPFDNIELRAKIRDISIRKRLKQFISEQVYEELKNSSGDLKPTVKQNVFGDKLKRIRRQKFGVDFWTQKICSTRDVRFDRFFIDKIDVFGAR